MRRQGRDETPPRSPSPAHPRKRYGVAGRMSPRWRGRTSYWLRPPYLLAFTRRPVTVSVAMGSPVSVLGSSGSSPAVNSRAGSRQAEPEQQREQQPQQGRMTVGPFGFSPWLSFSQKRLREGEAR